MTYQKHCRYSISVFILFGYFSCSDQGIENSPPNVQLSRLGAFATELYEGELLIEDPENDEVSVRLTNTLPNWLNFNSTSLTLSGLPGYADIGTIQLILSLDDGKEVVERNVNLTVTIKSIVCDQDFGDPEQSLYRIPIGVGRTTTVTQGYCRPPGSPGHVGYFVYDLSVSDFDTAFVARDGIVTAVRENQLDNDPNFQSGQENFAYIAHSDGTIARYVHFAKDGIFVNNGDQVNQGDALGLITRSGSFNSPHVHFDVFLNGFWDNYSFDIGRHLSLPVNFSNIDGPLDDNRALIHGESYLVLPD